MKRFFLVNGILLALLLAFIIIALNFNSLTSGGQTESLGNVYRSAMTSDPRTFDPAEAGDVTSVAVLTKVYESLYEYHYLKVKKYEVIPLLAEQMPAITDGGKTYTIRIKQGIYFQDNECFTNTGGKGREVTAQDFIYSFMRVADLKNRCPMYFIFQNRIAGLEQWRLTTAGEAPSDYTVQIPGLQALDRYTIQIRLTQPVPQFIYILAMANTCAVPHEAVHYYGDEFRINPVGTGPYVMEEYIKSSHIHYHKNPSYHPDFYPTEGDPGDEEAGLLRDAGQRVPFIDRYEIYIIKQSQPLWLKFLNGALESSGIPKDNFSEVLNDERGVRHQFAERGITLHTYAEPVVFYNLFNMRDAVVGGEENAPLRHAMNMAYDREWMIEIFYNGRGIVPHQPAPPGVSGFIEGYSNEFSVYDPDKARQILIDAGYDLEKGIDVEAETVASDTVSRQMSEAFKRMMARIGIRVHINYTTWSKYLEKLYSGGGQIYTGSGWGADYPDAENFYQLLVTGTSANHGFYSNPRFDELFRITSVMVDSPARDVLYRQMADIFKQDSPWLLTFTRIAYALKHPWVENYKLNDFCDRSLKYRRINQDIRKEYLGY